MSVERTAMQKWADWIANHSVEEFKFKSDSEGRMQMVITFSPGTRLPNPDDTHYGPDWDLRHKA